MLAESCPQPLGEHQLVDETKEEGAFLRWLLAKLLADTVNNYCWLEQNGFAKDFHLTQKETTTLSRRAKEIAKEAPTICRCLQPGSHFSTCLERAFDIPASRVQQRIKHLLTTTNHE